DAVLSFRVQPGAKPSVQQKFNRLEVVFSAPGATAAETGNNNANATASSSTENRGVVIPRGMTREQAEALARNAAANPARNAGQQPSNQYNGGAAQRFSSGAQANQGAGINGQGVNNQLPQVATAGSPAENATPSATESPLASP